MFYSQVILAKKGPLAKVWLAAHWGDKKLARPQIFATDISQSCTDIMNPSVPLALRLSGHLLLGVVRIYSRKVKYVLNDCTEAMLKLQMAFCNQAGGGKLGLRLDEHGKPVRGRELLSEKDAPTHQLVSNFGEYDQIHVVEGFCLPLPEDNEWILAEDEAGIGGGSVGEASQELLLAAHLPRKPMDGSGSGSPPAPVEEEEAWAPFDPDNEDEDDDDEGLADGSRVSDIEVVRAANDSLLSDDQTRRASSLLDKSALTANSWNINNKNIDNNENNNDTIANTNTNPQEEDYDFTVPFGEDDSDADEPVATTRLSDAGLGDSALQLSRDGGTPLSTGNAGLGLGLDADEDSAGNAGGLSDPSKREQLQREEEPKPPPRKRRRKRRKVVIDNHETELTNDHIRGMLRSTDDIVRPMVHPASIWDEEGTGKDYRALVLDRIAEQRGASRKRKKGVAFRDVPGPASSGGVPSLTRPFLADASESGGPGLHPVLQRLWEDNYWRANERPCPYRRLDPGGDGNDNDKDDKVVDDVEHVRRGTAASDDESTVGGRSELGVGAEKDDDDARSRLSTGQEMPRDDEMDFPVANDEEDEEDDEMDAPVPDFGDDEEDPTNLAAGGDDEDLLDLGMVNDMVLDSDEDDRQDDGEDDEDREAIGDAASSSTKWHKHTVRVFRHLKKCLRDPNADTDEDGGIANEGLPDSVGFADLTKNVVSRRNASSVFFEMLQLKTWDFIELEQERAYGDIAISAGLRFGEDAPEH